METGTTSFAGLQCSLGVATQCGSCACDVKQMLLEVQNKNIKMQSAEMMSQQQTTSTRNQVVQPGTTASL